jgi:hypothetical protein
MVDGIARLHRYRDDAQRDDLPARRRLLVARATALHIQADP